MQRTQHTSSIPDRPTTPRTATTKTNTGLTASTHSSAGTGTSSSAERYQLDEFDRGPILLYKYRGGLSTSSQKDLCAWLDKDPSHRVTKKPLPKYTSYLDIKRHDLFLPEERDKYADTPNFDASLAAVRVPLAAFVSRIFTGNYADLYIVSPEGGTPASSIGGSIESL